MRRIVFGRKKSKVILHLPFQNNYTDLTGLNTIVAGNSNGLPLFVTGRKGTDYAVYFNGSNSIRTVNALPKISGLYSLTVEFYIKTTQTGASMIFEARALSGGAASLPFCTINETANKMRITDLDSSLYNIGNSIASVNNGSWIHIVLTVDRSLGISQNKIYINKTLSYSQVASPYDKDIINPFLSTLLWLGQRSGVQLGFVGAIQDFKISNFAKSAAEVSEIDIS